MNRIKNTTQLQYRAIVKALDKMQVSEIKDAKTENNVYLRARIDPDQQVIIDKLGLKVPNDTIPQCAMNQYFEK